MLNLKQRAFPKQITAFHYLLLHSKRFQAEIIQISCISFKNLLLHVQHVARVQAVGQCLTCS